jgi:hypothetical protein
MRVISTCKRQVSSIFLIIYSPLISSPVHLSLVCTRHNSSFIIGSDVVTDNTSLPPPTRDFISKAFHVALTEGVAAYNRGNIQQCAEAYAKGNWLSIGFTPFSQTHSNDESIFGFCVAAAQITTPSHTHTCDSLCVYDDCLGTLHPLLDVMSRAYKVSRQPEFATNYMFQAWLLRRAFDFYYTNK